MGRDPKLVRHVINVFGSIQLVLIYLPLFYALSYASYCIFVKCFCKGVTKKPEDNNTVFVLKEIKKRISFFGSEDASSINPCEETLPYRLMSDDGGGPIEESVREEEEEEEDCAIITYS